MAYRLKYTKRTRGTDKELAAFKRCHDVIKIGRATIITWSRDLEGFYGWLDAIGPMPSDLNKASVSLRNHDFGYIAGNMFWEEHGIHKARRAIEGLYTAIDKADEQKEQPKEKPTLESLCRWNRANAPK